MNPQQLLEAYLAAPASQLNTYQENLCTVVRELVHRSVAKREVGDLEDFEEECVLAIWTKVAALRVSDGAVGIANIEGFVRQAVHNRYCDAIRRKRPKWYNLKLELMEISSGKGGIRGLALWQNPDSSGRIAGYEQWREKPASGSARCRELSDNAPGFVKKFLRNRDPKELPLHELAAAVLDYCGAPVDVDTLTSCLTELLQARNEEPLSIDSQPDSDSDATAPVDWLVSPDTAVEQQVVDSAWFSHVVDWFWREFQELSVKQRKAVLYGMPGEQVMALAAQVRLKSLAEAVEMSSEQLAALVGKLPLPDSVTAEELGILTRAVPSVRFKAWGRIRRRTRKSALIVEDE